MLRHRFYYALKPFVPWSVRMSVRRWFALRKRKRVDAVWPILPGSERPPQNWPGWPEGKKFAFVLTHDVEGPEGLAKVKCLAELEMSLGFRSSFNLIPEGPYTVPAELRSWLTKNGFEVGVHDLHHDGKLFSSRAAFTRKARRISSYLRDWNAVGFRSGFMLRHLDWLHDLEISYDATSFDTDPFEPQPEGVGTIFPFWVPRPSHSKLDVQCSMFDVRSGTQLPSSPSDSGVDIPHSAFRTPHSTTPSAQLSAFSSQRFGYVELPYTLPQDSTLFLVLREQSPDIWLRKLDWIARRGGMALVNVHPDYLRFPGEPSKAHTFPVEFYRQLLEHARNLSTQLSAPSSDLHAPASGQSPLSEFPLSAVDVSALENSPRSQLLASNSQASPPTQSASPSLLSAFEVSAFEKSPSHLALHSSQFQVTASGAAWFALPREIATCLHAFSPLPQNRSPLRVCMVTHSHYRTDNRVIRYAETLAARGDTVDVLCLRSRPDLPLQDRLEGVNVICLQDRFRKNEAGPSEHLLRTLRFLCIAAMWITRQHRRRPYDVLHIHNIPDFLVFAAWYPRLRGAKVILDIHDIVPEFFASKFGGHRRPVAMAALRLMEHWSARFAHRIIIANDLWLEKYATRTRTNDKCATFINNVNTKVFRPDLRARHNDGRQILIFPGGLQWHQGVDVAIRAFAGVVQVFPNAEFHIVGDGNMKLQWTALAKELGLADRVRFFAPVPVREIAQKMADADLGVVPKRADSFGNEAYSTKIMEFMALGVPVVASSTRVDRFYFDDSVLKFFESGNVDALAAAIIEVLTNQEATRQRVQRALDYAVKHSWETRRHDYLKLVDALCTAR